jgi:hypothetical protein
MSSLQNLDEGSLQLNHGCHRPSPPPLGKSRQGILETACHSMAPAAQADSRDRSPRGRECHSGTRRPRAQEGAERDLYWRPGVDLAWTVDGVTHPFSSTKIK